MTETATIDPNAQAVIDALGEGWSLGDPRDTEDIAFTNGDITVGVGAEHLIPENIEHIAAAIASAAADPDSIDEGDDDLEGDDEDAAGEEE